MEADVVLPKFRIGIALALALVAVFLNFLDKLRFRSVNL